MDSIIDELRKIKNATKTWSTKKKLFVIILIWALIFIPSIISYTSIHREKNLHFSQKNLVHLIHSRKIGTLLYLLRASK